MNEAQKFTANNQKEMKNINVAREEIKYTKE